MENIYDQARALASALKETEEYREYTRLKAVAYEDSTNKSLLDEYKRLQYAMQMTLAIGKNVDEEDMQKMQKLAAILQFNPDVSAYMLAEFRFQRMLSEIFQILGETAGIDLDALAGK